MTEWDKLWEDYERAGFMGIKIAPHDYMAKIKAEGDRMQKEGLEHHALAVEYYEKLEDIRELLRVSPVAPEFIPDIIMEMLDR